MFMINFFDSRHLKKNLQNHLLSLLAQTMR